MSIYRAGLRSAVLGGVAVGALCIANSAAWAQVTPATPPASPPQAAGAEETEAGDVVVITGSRLRQESFDSPNPILQIGGEEIDTKQVSNTIDAIEDIPLIGIGTNNRGTQVQNGDSFAFPDILDLGTQRTLTLLNGRRVVASNPGSVFVPGNASGSQVDLSVFTPSMIDRVEVLAGTGGAIYGADAVAGVVNLITKDDFEGFDLRAQAGITELGDGEQYRISGTWGSDLFDGRGHVMITGDYFHQDPIFSSTENATRYGGSGIANALDGATRNPAAFNAQDAVNTLLAGGTLAPAFLPASGANGGDGLFSTFFGPLSLQNPLITTGGALLSNQLFGAGFATNTNMVPATGVAGALAGRTADPQNFAFFAPSSLPTGVTAGSVISTLAPGTNFAALSAAQQTTLALALLQRNRPTPYEHFAANPSLNPLLFFGTFGTGNANFNNGAFPTIANTDPATAGRFPRIAVPLTFDGSGNLVPYQLGNILPPSQGRLGQTFGGGGYDAFAEGHSQVQAGTDRIALAATGSYDISDTLRYKSQWMYTSAEFEQIGGATTHGSSGSLQAGTVSIPIYIDQNPFLNAASRNTINGLAAPGSGFTVPTVGGQRVLFMGRALTDITGGGLPSTLEVDNFQVTQILEGEFDLGASDFYWDVAAGYGRSDQKSQRVDFLDHEFAMAIDVVTGPGGTPVCRQQTLAAPEPITVRNPGLSGTITSVGLTPTAAQVAACKPLNLFGNGAPSREAIDYVLGDANVHALNTLEYYSGSLGGNLFELPGGTFSVGLNAEFRRESAEFEPSRDTQLGVGRIAPQARGEGSSEFTEYGYEVLLPIFGEDFQFPLLRQLELSYAQRIVERETASPTVTVPIGSTSDDTFNYSLRWKPFDDLTLRAAKSRTVRSPSLVELVGPFTVAFSNLAANTNPCTTSAITQGPSPAIRRANCLTAVQRLGIAPDAAGAAAFLSTFTGTAGVRPANAGGNPGLVNEEADNYTVGFTFEPSFVPNLVVSVDFFSVDLENEIGLFGPATFTGGCFDSPDFPNSITGGARACDAFLFGTPTGPGGQFVIPSTNALTGNPGAGGVLAGSQAAVQNPFELAFVGFANLNLAVREFRGVNVETRYNFELADLPLVGGLLNNAGEIFLRTSYFQTQRYDLFQPTLDRLAGEHTNAEHEVRTDIRHRIGKFDQTLQWFWNSGTVTDVSTAKVNIPDQSPAFVADDFHFFNYAASYAVTDNMSVRLAVNNLFDTEEPRGIYGLTNQYDGGIGREFIFGVNARF